MLYNSYLSVFEFVGCSDVDGWLVGLKLIKSLHGAGTLNSYPICCVQCWNRDKKRRKDKLFLSDLTFVLLTDTK